MEFMLWVQETDFSTWIRESDWAIFAILIVHTIGMGFLVGVSCMVSLRTLGFAGQIPLSRLHRFVPILISSAIAAVISGVLLVIGYPAKALTNPLFYIKLVLIAIAARITRGLIRHYLTNDASDSASTSRLSRRLAVIGILLWLCSLTAGKFLAYTNKMLLL
jgi:uncharacterized membrane protein YphA (DoxX/SURF4 family)